MFGGIFDWNHDGKTDAFEAALGFSLLLAANEDTDTDDCFEDDDLEDDDLENLNDCEDLGEVSEQLEALTAQLSDLEEKLLEVELEEPNDCTSTAYDRWESRRDRLEERVEELRDRVSELEDRLF